MMGVGVGVGGGGGLMGMSSNQIETHLSQFNPVSGSRLESLIHKGLSSLLVKQGPQGNSFNNNQNNNQNPTQQATVVIAGNNNGTAVEDVSAPNYINNMRKKIENSNNSNQLLQYNSELIIANNSINKALSKEKDDLSKIQKKREKLVKELAVQLKNSDNNGNFAKTNESNASNAPNRYESDSFDEEDNSSSTQMTSPLPGGATHPLFAMNAINLSSASTRMTSMRQNIANASAQQSILSPAKAALNSANTNTNTSGNGNLPNYSSFADACANANANANAASSYEILNGGGGGGGGLGSALQSKYSVSSETVRNAMQAAGLNKAKTEATQITNSSANNNNSGTSENSGGSNDLASGQQKENSAANGQQKENSAATGQQKENSAANLSYSADDVNKMIQLYSFRMNKWEFILIEDYNSSNMFHKCKFVGDNSTIDSALSSKGASQWIDLKKKPIRSGGG